MVTRLQQELDDVQKRNDTQTSGKAAESDETSSTESSPEAENNSDTVSYDNLIRTGSRSELAYVVRLSCCLYVVAPWEKALCNCRT